MIVPSYDDRKLSSGSFGGCMSPTVRIFATWPHMYIFDSFCLYGMVWYGMVNLNACLSLYLRPMWTSFDLSNTPPLQKKKNVYIYILCVWWAGGVGCHSSLTRCATWCGSVPVKKNKNNNHH